MLQVMHYMHINQVAHRDLKPENIFMDDKFNLRFADFGFAAAMQGHDGSGFLKTILGTTAYMAPELITKTAYFGHNVDLFALGIILFILYTGHPPFNTANPKDPHYRLLAEGQADLFWKQHSKSKEKGFFSEEFMDLITNMLQVNPCHRLSLADIVGHEWMQGKTADASSVRAEFAKRAARIKKDKAEEAAASARQNQTMKQGGKKVRALKMINDETEEMDELPELSLAKFDKNIVVNMDNVFYSTYRADGLMNLFEEACKDKDIKYTRDNAKSKLIFTCLKDQTDEEREIELPQEGFQAKVKFAEVDKGKVAVEFTKLAGSSDYYRDQMSWMKSVIQDYMNVAVEE